MARMRICPWWLGYVLASPLRRLIQDPHAILAPYVKQGMIVVEPGPGMGFFTEELARLVGAGGRVVAVDLQQRMLDGLRRRLSRAFLAGRVSLRLAAGPERMGLDDLRGAVDFVFAFALVHELPDADRFFAEVHDALKPGGLLLLGEPLRHVPEPAFAATLEAASRAGLRVIDRPVIRWSRNALLER